MIGRRVGLVLSVVVLLRMVASPSPMVAQSSLAEQERQVIAKAAQLEREGNIDQARSELERFLIRSPTSPGVLVQLAQVGSLLGDPSLVLAFAERAVELTRTGDPTVLQVWIRALAAAGRADSALAAARAWVNGQPLQILSHAELAGVLAGQGRTGEAIDALQAGREAVGDASVYAQELGGLYAGVGDLVSAAREWRRVLGWGDAGVSVLEPVLSRTQPDYTARVEALRAAISEGESSYTTLHAATAMANRLEEAEWSLEVAERVIKHVPLDTRLGFLRDYAMDARNRDLPRNAVWAADRLAEQAPDSAERLRWRSLGAQWAVEAGDGPAAASAFEDILRRAPSGSRAHEDATRSLFAARVDGDPAEAERLLRSFRALYARETTDLARMGVALSEAWVRAGKLQRARQALVLATTDSSDPSAVARLEGESGLVELYAGHPAQALEHLEVMSGIPGGDPRARSEAIALADALSRADSAEVSVFSLAVYEVERGEVEVAMRRLTEAWRGVTASPARPALLNIAAQRMQRHQHTEEAARLYHSLLDKFPGVPEAPPAMLAIARGLSVGDPPAAQRWLKRLILEYPSSALAPVARRILAELEGRVPTGPAS